MIDFKKITKKGITLAIAGTFVLSSGISNAKANDAVVPETGIEITQPIETTILSNLNFWINGKKLLLSDQQGNPVTPIIYNGNTYLSLRSLAEAFGYSVDFDINTNTATLTSGAFEPNLVQNVGYNEHFEPVYENVTIHPGSKFIIDGQEFKPTDVNGNPVPTINIDGTNYVPVRAAINAFGELNIEYVPSTVKHKQQIAPTIIIYEDYNKEDLEIKNYSDEFSEMYYWYKNIGRPALSPHPIYPLRVNAATAGTTIYQIEKKIEELYLETYDFTILQSLNTLSELRISIEEDYFTKYTAIPDDYTYEIFDLDIQDLGYVNPGDEDNRINMVLWGLRQAKYTYENLDEWMITFQQDYLDQLYTIPALEQLEIAEQRYTEITGKQYVYKNGF